MKYILDANVIIRFLTQDHPVHSPMAFELFKKAVRKEITLYLDTLVVSECVFVLNGKNYGFTKTEIAENLVKVIEFAGIECPDKNLLVTALEMFARYNIDFTDAYLSAKSEIEPSSVVITFNTKDFNRTGVNNITPLEIVERQ